MALEPYIRKFVSPCQGHSNHESFIDTRSVSSVIHLWTTFVARILKSFALRLPSTDFCELHTSIFSYCDACRSISGSVLGRYPFIPLLELEVH